MLSTHSSGFTLLEVMVAMAILATAFVAVLRLHSDSMEMVISSRAHTKAAELAQYKMTEIKNAVLENLFFKSGEFTEYDPDYRWEIRVEPSQFGNWGKITVTVTNQNMGKSGEFSLVEYMPLGEPEEKPKSNQ